MTIDCRCAALEDLKEIQELFVETIKSTCRNDYNEDQIKAWVSSVTSIDRWNSFILNQYFLLAVINNKIVGFGSLDIANFLFENLKNEGLRLGFNTLSSDVSKTAIPFFERKGFKIISVNKNRVNEVELINYHMLLSNTT